MTKTMMVTTTDNDNNNNKTKNDNQPFILFPKYMPTFNFKKMNRKIKDVSDLQAQEEDQVLLTPEDGQIFLKKETTIS